MSGQGFSADGFATGAVAGCCAGYLCELCELCALASCELGVTASTHDCWLSETLFSVRHIHGRPEIVETRE